MTGPRGTFCLVLHTHLPWLAHAGRWPVGEEWLHQAWADAYLPIARLLRRLADAGRRDVLTLGVTPVLAAMLDDPYLLRELHDWLGNRVVRSWELAARPGLGPLAAVEHANAVSALAEFESRWRHGASPVLRELAGSGVVELLGGPATHVLAPLAEPRVAELGLAVGLDDAAVRLGARPRGIWAPECAYAPGLEEVYARHGVERFVCDGPALHGDTSAARTVGGSDVVVFGRDLEVSYRVWSPRSGYPAGAWYRDFHTFDHPTGFRAYRVTSVRTPPEQKRPYDPERARAAVEADARDFVDVVVARLAALPPPGLVVAAYDTELFGHWWAEGPAWLERVLDLLPAAGVRVSSLRGALDCVRGPVDLPPSSWGSGKDFHVWDGPLTDEAREAQRDLLDLLAKRLRPGSPRSAALDQAVREVLLGSASDWAFMVAKDSAPDFARRRHDTHLGRFRALRDALAGGHDERAARLAAELRRVDGPFGHLDARCAAHLPGGGAGS